LDELTDRQVEQKLETIDMEPFKVEGILKRVSDVQEISERFKKREFVIETQEQYPQVIQFQSVQDRVNLIDGFQPGDKIEVFFNLRGREWQKDSSSEVRVFVTLDAWRISKVEDMPAGSGDEAPTEQYEDDLPF